MNSSRIVIFACLILILVFALGVWWIFEVHRPTEFAAQLDAKSISFVTGDNDIKVRDVRERGLFAASDRIVDLRIDGCQRLDAESSNTQAVSCVNGSISATHVRLSNDLIADNTDVRLRFSDDMLIIEMRVRGKGFPEIGLDSLGDKQSEFDGRRQPLARHWRVMPNASNITIALRIPGDGAEVPEEEGIIIKEGSSIGFSDDEKSSLVGTDNHITLPELPKELETVTIERGDLKLAQLQSATIKSLRVEKKGKLGLVFKLNVAGMGKELLLTNAYSGETENQALTTFDANSGKDRKLRTIGIFLLVLGTLSIFSSVLTISLHSLELYEKYRAWKGDDRAERSLRVRVSEGDEEEFEVDSESAVAQVERAESTID